MKLTPYYLEKILKTLPVSYYLGRGYSISISNLTKLSYTDLIAQEIVISYEQLITNNSDYATEEDMEKDIRCMLYHELSHAMLTPIPQKFYIDKDIFNIFEDERIETLLEGFYLNTDFKGFVKKLYGDTTDPFYRAVRFRECSEQINDKINEIIKKYAYLHYTPSPQKTRDYQLAIQELYNQIITAAQDNLNKAEETQTLTTVSTNASTNLKFKEELAEESYVEQMIDNLYIYSNEEFGNKINMLLKNRQQLNLKSGSGHGSRTGHILPKLITKPESYYKWFRKTGEGELNSGSSVKLNLFIDKSGSAKQLETTLNSYISELTKLEKKHRQFRFDLVTIDNLTKLRDRSDRTIICEGGNCLYSELKNIFYKVQESKLQNINIVLFYGNAITDDANDHGKILKAGSLSQAEWFSVFNHSNTLIISDPSNKKWLEEYCKKAKVIITLDYLSELENVLLKFLQQNLK